MENQNQMIDMNAVKAKAHRKVKSGVPEHIAQNSLKMPMVMQQINYKPNQGGMMVTPESKICSSG